MKEEIKKYFNTNIYKLEEEKKEINNNYFTYYEKLESLKDRTEEERKKEIEKLNKEREEKNKKLLLLDNKINQKTIEKNLIYNNIIYLFYKNYHNNIINIMEKYQNKNIGEKTKEKIQEELKELLKQDNIFTSVYYSFGRYSHDIYELNFTIYENEKAQKNYSYNKITFNIVMCKYYDESDQQKYNNYYIYRNETTCQNIINNNKIWNNNTQYEYIKDTNTQAKIILKECKKSIKKVNDLINKAKEEREEHNILLNKYKIHEFENIKINYEQRL